MSGLDGHWELHILNALRYFEGLGTGNAEVLAGERAGALEREERQEVTWQTAVMINQRMITEFDGSELKWTRFAANWLRA